MVPPKAARGYWKPFRDLRWARYTLVTIAAGPVRIELAERPPGGHSHCPRNAQEALLMTAPWIAMLLAALVSVPVAAGAEEREPDQISKLLFEAYLNGPRKINSETILAASVIVADRGRRSGFWKEVLAELKSG